MASFQAKIGQKMLRKREKIRIIVLFRSYPTRKNKLQKNSKKIQKTKKIPFQLFFKPKQVGKGQEREKIKIIVLISSYPTRYREFQKNSQKILKIKKHHYGFFWGQNRLKKPEKERN